MGKEMILCSVKTISIMDVTWEGVQGSFSWFSGITMYKYLGNFSRNWLKARPNLLLCALSVTMFE